MYPALLGSQIRKADRSNRFSAARSYIFQVPATMRLAPVTAAARSEAQ